MKLMDMFYQNLDRYFNNQPVNEVALQDAAIKRFLDEHAGTLKDSAYNELLGYGYEILTTCDLCSDRVVYKITRRGQASRSFEFAYCPMIAYRLE